MHAPTTTVATSPADRKVIKLTAVIGLKFTFNAWQAHGVRANYQLKLDGEPYWLRADDGALHAQQGEAERADLTIRTTGLHLLDLLGAHFSVREVLADGLVEIEGPKSRAFEQFVRLFGWGAARGPDGSPS